MNRLSFIVFVFFVLVVGCGKSPEPVMTSVSYSLSSTASISETPSVISSTGSGTAFKISWNPDVSNTNKYPNGYQFDMFLLNQSSPPINSAQTASIVYIVNGNSTGAFDMNCTYSTLNSKPVLNCGSPVPPITGGSGVYVNSSVDTTQYSGGNGFVVMRIGSTNEYKSVAVTLN